MPGCWKTALSLLCGAIAPYVVAIAETLDCKICVSREKKLILDCLDDKSLCQRLTMVKHEARVHVLAMNQINANVCSSSMLRRDFTDILAHFKMWWLLSSNVSLIRGPCVGNERVIDV